MNQRKKRAFTLLEIMIVICIIGLLSGVVGFNMKGSLEKGKATRTEVVMTRVKDILDMEIASGADPEDVVHNYKEHLENCGILKNPEEFQKDGWGKPLQIELGEEDEVHVLSETYSKYCEKKGRRPVEF